MQFPGDGGPLTLLCAPFLLREAFSLKNLEPGVDSGWGSAVMAEVGGTRRGAEGCEGHVCAGSRRGHAGTQGPMITRRVAFRDTQNRGSAETPKRAVCCPCPPSPMPLTHTPAAGGSAFSPAPFLWFFSKAVARN